MEGLQGGARSGTLAGPGIWEAMADLETREAMADLSWPRRQIPVLEPYYPPKKKLGGAYGTERGIRSPPWAQRGIRLCLIPMQPSSSNPNQTHLNKQIKVFRITRKVTGEFDQGWN